ncbi:MAG: glycosyltransferase [Pseudomonadota bacterium]
MRIALETLGTRGDVQPYLALAVELMRRGHAVQLTAPQQFAGFAAAWSVPFAALPGEFLELLDRPEGKAAVAGSRGFMGGLKLLGHIKPLMGRLLDAEWDAVRHFGPDLVLHHPKCLAAPHIAERLHIPSLLASPLPGFTPTSAFPSPLLPFGSLGPLNKVSHSVAPAAMSLLFGGQLSSWRKQLGLPRGPVARRPAATLYAYSRHVVPVPADWSDDVFVSGYWFLDAPPDWRMPKDLATFLEAGDKPVYVGFGSMPGIDAVQLAQKVVDALAIAGKRGIVATGGGALRFEAAPPGHVHVLASAPHDELFRHVSAALHHGGAGTTGASLRAGLPTVICPFLGDQPYWGRRVHALGVGPKPLDRRKLTAAVLADAFRATDDGAMRARAEGLGRKIRSENGVACAADVVERFGRPEAA